MVVLVVSLATDPDPDKSMKCGAGAPSSPLGADGETRIFLQARANPYRAIANARDERSSDASSYDSPGPLRPVTRLQTGLARSRENT
ncbi:hypothetical protein Ddc_20244 [Ditylenchus destructor]|nr:hypothetical protein Ddc_20244 [Ditylenchus destructor]